MPSCGSEKEPPRLAYRQLGHQDISRPCPGLTNLANVLARVLAFVDRPA
jgi:hypothetical protein